MVDKGPVPEKLRNRISASKFADDAPDWRDWPGRWTPRQGGADQRSGLFHPFLSLPEIGALCQVVRANNPEAAIGEQLLRRVCGDIGAHPGRGRLDGGFLIKTPAAGWLPLAAILPDGGNLVEGPPCVSTVSEGVRLHLWGQPQPLSRAFPCPIPRPRQSRRRCCRPDDGAAGLPDEPTSDTVRHDIIQMIHLAPEPLKILQRHQFGARWTPS